MVRKLLGLLAVAASLASADVIAVLDSGPISLGGGDFGFNYRADLSGDERLDPTATNGVTCPGPGSSVIQCSPIGTFFTIYDILGFVSANTSASGWSVTTSNTGVTPSTINSTPIDNPSIVNVTFTYTGPVVHAGGTTVSFTGFQIISTLSNLNPSGTFTSQSTKDAGGSVGDTDQLVGSVDVPQSAVPEPTTYLLLGLGLTGLAFVQRRARRQE